MTAPTAPNGWRVTGQNYGEDLMPDGKFHDVAKVTITSVDGATTTLTIPLAQYSPDTVIQLGNYWYERHAAVMAIGN